MPYLSEKLGDIRYLELMAPSTPATAFAGALSLIGTAKSIWILAPRLSALPDLNPETLLVCAPTVKEAYWACEQALKSGAVQSVCLVLDGPYDLSQSRRFKLATQAHGTRLIAIMPASVQNLNSAAQERWHIAPKITRRPHSTLTRWQQLKNKKGTLTEMDVEDYARSLSMV